VAVNLAYSNCGTFVSAERACKNGLILGRYAIVETAMNQQPKQRNKSRRIPIAAFSFIGIAAAAITPVAAIAAGQPIEIRVAYLDPGTGSLILQALVAALAGIVVAVTSYWQKIRGFFSRRSRDSESSDTASSDD
jgi:hypothetical protein